MDGQKACERRPNITSYLRNANLSYKKWGITSHPSEWLLLKKKKKKSTNSTCWRGCGEKGTLLHHWWECKLVQLLRRPVWRFLIKLEIPGVGTGNLLQYSYLENATDRGAWRATVHRVTELDTAEHTQAKNTAFSKWCKSGPWQVDSAFHRKQKRLYIQFWVMVFNFNRKRAQM